MDTYRRAVALFPGHAAARFNLGVELEGQNKLAEAEAAYRAAVAARPDHPEAHSNLGALLFRNGRTPEAAAELQRALEVKPDLHEALYNLACIRSAEARLTEAESLYRQAVAARPEQAETYCNLGDVLKREGRFAESLASYRRGHELGSRRPGWPYPSAVWVRDAERHAELDARVSAAGPGVAAPSSPADAVELAGLCGLKRWPATAARYYAAAFAAQPALADAPGQHRYAAACVAALAAAGRGDDAARLPAPARASLRRQALDWLRAELAALTRFPKPPQSPAALQQLLHWQTDPDLAEVRDPAALAQLPDADRTDWQKLWADAAELQRKVGP